MSVMPSSTGDRTRSKGSAALTRSPPRPSFARLRLDQVRVHGFPELARTSRERAGLGAEHIAVARAERDVDVVDVAAHAGAAGIVVAAVEAAARRLQRIALASTGRVLAYGFR